MSQPTIPGIPPAPATSVGSEIVSGLQVVLPIVTQLAAMFVPGGVVVAGLTVPQVLNLVNGLVAGEPAVEHLVAVVQGMASGGPAPTAAELAAIDADFDSADAKLAAADAAVIAKGAGTT